MESTKKTSHLILFVLLMRHDTSLWSNGGLQIKGKLRILRPTTLQVKDLNGTPCS